MPTETLEYRINIPHQNSQTTVVHLFRSTVLLIFLIYSNTVIAQIPQSENAGLNFSTNAPDSANIMQRINQNSTLTVFYPDSALGIYSTLLEQSKQINFAYGAATSLLMYSNAYRFLGLYPQSLESCGEALIYCYKSPNTKRLLAFTYNQIGIIYKAMGDHVKAAHFFHMAIRATEQYPNSDIHAESIYINLSSTLANDTLAVNYLQQAILIAEQRMNYESLGIALINIALKYHDLKDGNQYWYSLQRAYRLGQEQKDTLLQYRSLMGLAGYANEYVTPEQALSYIQQARRLKIDRDPEAFHHNANQYMTGHVFYELGQYKNAERFWQATLKTAEALQMTDQVAQTHQSFAKLYSKTGDYTKAYKHQSLYLSLKDSLMNSRIARDINQMEVEYRTAEKDKLIAQAQRETERKNFLIILTSGGVIILSASFFVFYRHTRQKQKMLQQKREIGQLKNVMKGEEKERGRIAQELHDGIGGMLGAIKMQASRVRDTPDAAKFRDLMQMIDETAGEVRRTSHNLLPGMLEKHTLEEALTLYCDNINKNTALQIDVQFHGATTDLDQSVTLVIYRIAQELIQNVIKHAQATIADVQVTRNGNLLNIIVEDNGVGFNAEDTSKGIGLFNMEQRVQAMRGYMAIDSIKGKSTTIFIEFDLEKLKLEV